MACGKSIICSDIPANTEMLVHNQEAILVNPDEQKQIVKALWLLINDSSLRTRLGKNSIIKASQFDERIIEKWNII